MGAATRVVQTSIGLVAELKAAKKDRKASQACIAETESVAHKDQLLAEVQQLRISASESETDPTRRDQLQAEVAQLRIKRSGSSSSSSSPTSQLEPTDHFGDDSPPLYAPNTIYPDDLDSDSSDSPPPYTDEELAQAPSPTDTKFPPPSPTFVRTPLLHPVIIPQRRPGSKTRGFLRAYAPALAAHDIPADTFLAFLKSFHHASQASPILTAITLGAGTLGQIPEPGSMLAGIGVTILSGAAENLQQRYRTNAYLDSANEKLFKPRGLYCLIMSFRPGAVPEGDVAIEAVDTSKHALKWLSGPTQSSFKTNFRNSSGTTNGEIEMPEAAALIYPSTELESKSKSEKEDGKSSGAAYSKRKVAANYFDKRAQAAYAFKHPTSALATETPPSFASKYGDPTHPAVTTSDTGRFLSKYKHEPLEERQFRERAKEVEKAVVKNAKDAEKGKAKGNSSRLRQNLGDMSVQLRAPDIVQNILYLMVVDLPSEEMMERARGSVEPDRQRASGEERRDID